MPRDSRAGQATFWQAFGTGARPVLALHCALGHSGAWAAIGEALAQDVTLTAFDLPGHGQSGDWDEQTEYLTLSARIAADFVGDAPLDLIGHSFGAVAALRLALAAPEAVRTLTLIEPVLLAAARGSPEHDWYDDAMAPFHAALAEGRPAAAAETFVGLWGEGGRWQDLDAAARDKVIARLPLIGATTAALESDTGRLLAPDALEGLQMPVMLIRGTASPAVIAVIAEALAARLPDVGVATVPGAGHMLPLTHPAEVAGLIAVNLGRG